MKFQSIVISCVVFFFPIAAVENGSLTIEESKERLENCGRSSSYPIDSQPWLWVIRSRNPEDPNRPLYSAATLVSPRHLLTSSRAVFTPLLDWIEEEKIGHNVKEWECIEEPKNVKVPDDILQHLTIYKNDCLPPCKSNFKIKPVKAYVLGICDKGIQERFSASFTPMIVELDHPIMAQYINTSYRCLSDEKTTLERGGQLFLYQFGDVMEPIKELNFYSNNERFLVTDYFNYPPNDGYGNPLMKLVDHQWTIIGIATHNLDLIQGSRNMFHNLQWYQKDLYDLVGICVAPPEVTWNPEIPTSFQPSTVPTVTQPSPNATQSVPDRFEASTTLQLSPISTISNEIEYEIEETEPHDYLHDETVFREIESREDLRSEFYDDEDEKDRGNGSGIRKLFIGFMVVHYEGLQCAGKLALSLTGDISFCVIAIKK
ncbi:hypothetical protein CAEBREN_12421 [Caenorhabditis brenneri]|uniref:Peptidase S1 domain-containing protein n=1 Tax=Caenorhabditis brenneri TaxID=135651 RepID=G0MJ34_CAEBE|nr:hypothetical protein CAEBREN_12421 [Caenorhabditis brenneri]